MNILFFNSATEFRAWLVGNHDKEQEVWVGFFNQKSERTGISYSEAVDQALCFGWIDGIRKSVDETRYKNRFTPRKPRSIWSRVNLAKVARLIEEGAMHPAGMKVYESRDPERSQLYSFEQERPGLDKKTLARFRKNAVAWKFFQAQPPSYRRTAGWWVMSAKRVETRAKRLETLIRDSEAGRRLAMLTRTPKK